MNLHCLGSNSKGNGYILEGASSTLLLEAGIKFDAVKEALDFKIDKIDGCLITHEHKDHLKFAESFMKQGIQIYATPETLEGVEGQYKNYIQPKVPFQVGEFRIMPFSSVHDAKNPLNFLIQSMDSGKRILFLTDTAFSRYTFRDIDTLMIEANYKDDLLTKNVEKGIYPSFVADRIRQSHMELETTIKTIMHNPSKNVILIHLSEKNSNAMEFRSEVIEKTEHKKVLVAGKGMYAKL